MKVAIAGCCHGELDKTYASLPESVDLLLVCGDFQSMRNLADLECMSCPEKYKRLGDFSDYYSGKKKAPVLTIFIGGNHEASNYLTELKYGGFVAPNIYYLGKTGVVWYNGLRIGGISGIFKSNHFMKPNWETVPFNQSSIRSIYHYRRDDIFKLRLLNECNDTVFLSHDWPEGIYNYGSLQQLLKRKPFFKDSINKRELGSPPAMRLLHHLKPRYWFSAHLHVKFTAKVSWSEKRLSEGVESNPKKVKSTNKDEIDLDLDEFDEETLNKDKKTMNKDEIELDFEEDEQETSTEIKEKDSLHATEFLALDKCLPKRRYLEVLDIPTSKVYPSPGLMHDIEYISVLKVVEANKNLLDHLQYADIVDPPAKLMEEFRQEIRTEMKKFLDMDLEKSRELFTIDPGSFVETASSEETELKVYINPQTTDFISRFNLQ